MLDLLITIPAAGPSVGSPGLESYGPIGVFGAVLLFVLGALYKMNEKARESEAKRLDTQLAAIERISAAQTRTADALSSTVAGLGVVTSRLDDIVRDLREVAGKRDSE